MLLLPPGAMGDVQAVGVTGSEDSEEEVEEQLLCRRRRLEVESVVVVSGGNALRCVCVCCIMLSKRLNILLHPATTH